MSINTNVQNLATFIATDVKAVNTLLNGNAVNNNALTTTAKNNLVAAINELKTAIDAAPTSGGVTSQINAAIAALVDAAPESLNTIRELADANATVLTALASRVRVDAAQAFNSTQKNQACDNIGAAKAADLGDPNTDFTAVYTTARNA